MPPIGTRPPWGVRRVEFDTPQEAMNAAVLLHAFGIDVFVTPSHRTAPVEHDVWTVEVTR